MIRTRMKLDDQMSIRFGNLEEEVVEKRHCKMYIALAAKDQEETGACSRTTPARYLYNH